VSGRILVRETAEAEIDEIAAYIAVHNLPAAIRFYDAIEATFDQLARMPGMGARRRARDPSLAELRSWPLTQFRNYLVFYLPLPDGIEVLHVWHGARNLSRLIIEEP
jgi:toxin ParE1/3/4